MSSSLFCAASRLVYKVFTFSVKSCSPLVVASTFNLTAPTALSLVSLYVSSDFFDSLMALVNFASLSSDFFSATFWLIRIFLSKLRLSPSLNSLISCSLPSEISDLGGDGVVSGLLFGLVTGVTILTPLLSPGEPPALTLLF